MLKVLLFPVFLFLGLSLQAQTYAYSFKGELTEGQSQSISEAIRETKSVLSVELRYKPEKEMGEFIFSVDPMENNGENDHPFSPVDIKAILISNQLEPLEFRQIK